MHELVIGNFRGFAIMAGEVQVNSVYSANFSESFGLPYICGHPVLSSIRSQFSAGRLFHPFTMGQ
jgi:hypothetical protein